MKSIRITSTEDGKSIFLPTLEEHLADQLSNTSKTGLLIFTGDVGSGKLTLAQATVAQFNSDAILYGELRDKEQVSSCLEESQLKLCVATIHAESEVDVLEALNTLGLLESTNPIKAVFYCRRENQVLECRKLELN